MAQGPINAGKSRGVTAIAILLGVSVFSLLSLWGWESQGNRERNVMLREAAGRLPLAFQHRKGRGPLREAPVLRGEMEGEPVLLEIKDSNCGAGQVTTARVPLQRLLEVELTSLQKARKGFLCEVRDLLGPSLGTGDPMLDELLRVDGAREEAQSFLTAKSRAALLDTLSQHSGIAIRVRKGHLELAMEGVPEAPEQLESLARTAAWLAPRLRP